jgi:hypothetical protein
MATATAESTHVHPVPFDHQGGDNYPSRAEHVAPDLQVGSLDVHTIVFSRAQNTNADQIDDETDSGNGEH